MIWLSVNRDFFISVDPFLWKKFYLSALRNFGGITAVHGVDLIKERRLRGMRWRVQLVAHRVIRDR